jgi:acetyltransferase
MGVTVQPMIRQEGYELIIGSSVDPQFGPVLLFGSGGQLVEVYRDRALGLPPLNTTLAHRLMEQTRIYRALKGVRGRGAVDLPALQSLLVRFSQLVVEQPRISEIDINPLLASREQLLALDARMVLHGPQLEDDELPRTAIRPYPSQYISRWKMKDTGEVLIRPIRPEDEPLMVRFHGTLSESTVYLRYFHMEKVDSRIAHERLIRKCFIDYDREIALVAIRRNTQSGADELIGVGRLTRQHALGEAELAVIVTDRYQGRGLGTELVRQLIEIARKEKLQRVLAHMLADNHAMLSLARRFHFDVRRDEDDPIYRTAVLELEP